MSKQEKDYIDSMYYEYINKRKFINEKYIPRCIKNAWFRYYDRNIHSRLAYKFSNEGIYIWELKWLINYFQTGKNHHINIKNNECSFSECDLVESYMNKKICNSIHIRCYDKLHNLLLKYNIDIFSKENEPVETRICVIDCIVNKYTTVKKTGDIFVKLGYNDIMELKVANKVHYVSLNIYNIIFNLIKELITEDRDIL